MKIIKVFLAKSYLARGLDVEFIKSSLTKVENLVIVESGSRITPSECDIFIYVPGTDDNLNATEVSINKVVFLKLDNFLKGKYSVRRSFLFVTGINLKRERVEVQKIDLKEIINTISESKIPLKEVESVDILTEICASFPHLNYSKIKSVGLRHDPGDTYGLPPIPSTTKRLLGKHNMRNLSIEKPRKFKK